MNANAQPTLRHCRASTIRDHAYHEAGHAVVMLGFGVKVSSVWVMTEYDPRERESIMGRTQADPFAELPRPDRQAGRLWSLAGDAVDLARNVKSMGLRHTQEVVDDIRRERPELDHEDAVLWMRVLLLEAEALVAASWAEIERMAAVLAVRHELYNLTPETWREAIA